MKEKISIEEDLQNPIYRMVGQNIKKLRIIKGLDQDELATMTGYCRLTIRERKEFHWVP
ncbi:hypothetical protein M3226_30645 [Neobacillus cucumis]|uniref:hypothetical protein n=1 Tax=Neobacillus cucumis TaxID=1740721 RepID=UPI00203AD891|nr:hypothetical protein [Neobacillus cucumis]MCM3729885.1 hypothetical protein [Neobacillus cucumis]